jgi:hypothetical protein
MGRATGGEGDRCAEATQRVGHVAAGRGDRVDGSQDRLRTVAIAAILIGVGTALLYPARLAAAGDVTYPPGESDRCRVPPVRDTAHAVSGLLDRLVAAALDLPAAVWAVAALRLAFETVVASPQDPAAGASVLTEV